MLHSLMLEDTWGTSVSQSHNSTGSPCVACLAPSLPASCPGPDQWMLGVLAVEKQGARSGEKQDGLWAEAPSPWFMLHCPIQLHLQNTNSKIKLLKISRWRSQSIKLEARHPSEQKALHICTGCLLMTHEPCLPPWNSKSNPHLGLLASTLVLWEGVWFRRCPSHCKLKARIPEFSQVIPCAPCFTLCVWLPWIHIPNMHKYLRTRNEWATFFPH